MPYVEGIETSEEELHSCHVTTVQVQSEQAVKLLQKPVGSYITIETGKSLSKHDHAMSVGECLAEVLDRVLRPHYHGKLCVCGIGNRDFPADALGPEVMRNLPLKVISELANCLLLADSLITQEPARIFRTIQLSTNGGLNPQPCSFRPRCLELIKDGKKLRPTFSQRRRRYGRR